MKRDQFFGKPSIIIVGLGVVGSHVLRTFPWAEVLDPPKGKWPTHNQFRFAFICVPTEMLEDGGCDTSVVEHAVSEVDADLIIIRSTIPPGTTNRLIAKTGKRIIFCPEFYGETQHALINPDFVILGGEPELTNQAAQLFMLLNDASFRIFQTDSVTAELDKYMVNSFLAGKVVFCSEFYHLAQKFGVSYPELRELFIMDKRVGPYHTFVYDETPYYDSHCFNKDIPAIINHAREAGYQANFLKAIVQNNEKFRKGELECD
jgi:UDPglucose 6-dehydrogenase